MTEVRIGRVADRLRAAFAAHVLGRGRELEWLERALVDEATPSSSSMASAIAREHPGAVASRDQLLESVWGQAHTGSNVVDAVVRSLRRTLGPYAGAIQTVTGFGYRLAIEG